MQARCIYESPYERKAEPAGLSRVLSSLGLNRGHYGEIDTLGGIEMREATKPSGIAGPGGMRLGTELLKQSSRIVVCLLLLLVAFVEPACVVAVAQGGGSQETLFPWASPTPVVPAGSAPLTMLVDSGANWLYVVNSGLTAEASGALALALQTQGDEKTKIALENISLSIAKMAACVMFMLSPSGQLIANREVALYSYSENRIEKPPAEPTIFPSVYIGAPRAATRIKRADTEYLLVATDEYLFELNPATAAVEAYPLGELPRGINWMGALDVAGDGKEVLVVVADQLVGLYVYSPTTRAYTKLCASCVWLRAAEGGVLGFRPVCGVLADVNGDGLRDILVVNGGTGRMKDPSGEIKYFEDSTVHVIMNHSASADLPTFGSPIAVSNVADLPQLLAVGTFGGVRGRLDWVVWGSADQELVFLPGSLSGGRPYGLPDPGAKRKVLASGVRVVDLVADDLDEDGITDLVVVFGSPTKRVQVYWGPFGDSDALLSSDLSGPTDPQRVVVVRPAGAAGKVILVLDAQEKALSVFSVFRWPGRAIGTYERNIARRVDPLLGYGATSLAFGVGDRRNEDFALAIVRQGLTREAAPKANVSVGEPTTTSHVLLGTLTERKIGNLYVSIISKREKTVPVIAKGLGFAGTPVQPGETTDYSFQVLTQRKPTGEDVAPHLVRSRGMWVDYPQRVFFLDMAAQVTMPDAFLVTQALSVTINPSPWLGGVSAPSLSDSIPRFVGEKPYLLGVADVSRDGVLDLVVVEAASQTCAIYLGEASKRTGVNVDFPSIPRYKFALNTAWCTDMVMSDFDGDGAIDVAFVDAGSNRVVVLWGDRPRPFTMPLTEVSVGRYPVAGVSVLGGGGGARAALAVACAGSDEVRVISWEVGPGGKVDRGTPRQQIIRVGNAPVAIGAGKLDWLVGAGLDEYVDLAVACYGSDEIWILRGGSGGGFAGSPVGAGPARLRNVVGVDVATRSGKGPTAIVVADFDLDNMDDVAFSIAFPRERLRFDTSRVVAGDARGRAYMEGLWEDVFIYYSRRGGTSGGGGSSARSGSGVDIAVGRDGGRPVVGVLHTVEDARRGGEATVRKISLFAFESDGASWKFYREYLVDAGVTRFALGDIDGDGRLDVVTLDSFGNRLNVAWGDGSRRPTELTTSPGASTLVMGISSQGCWILAGERVWVARPPGFVFGEGGCFVIDLGGGGSRDAAAVSARGGRGPPDLLVLSTRNEVRVFSGQALVAGKGNPSIIAPGPRGFFAARAVAGYFDRDDALDVALASFGGTDAVHVGIGMGSWNALGEREYAAGCALALADLDTDGLADLVVLSYSPGSTVGCLRVFAGRGDGGFTEPATTWLQGYADWRNGSVVSADVDGDTRPEVVVWETGQSRIFVLWHRDAAAVYAFGSIEIVTRRLNLGLWGGS